MSSDVKEHIGGRGGAGGGGGVQYVFVLCTTDTQLTKYTSVRPLLYIVYMNSEAFFTLIYLQWLAGRKRPSYLLTPKHLQETPGSKLLSFARNDKILPVISANAHHTRHLWEMLDVLGIL